MLYSRMGQRFFTFPVWVALVAARVLQGADCNGNGVDDASDLVLENFGFLTASRYAVGIEPTSLITADLNGDGKPDLATGNRLSNDVFVLLNQGDGSFNDSMSYPVVGGAGVLISTDINGDENPDLVTANEVESDNVSVLINQGEGSFKDAVSYPVGIGPGSLITTDLNGDGKPDLATANVGGDGKGTVSVLLNRGDGSFGDAVSFAVGNRPVSLITADLNGDGKPDLATVTYVCPACNPPNPSSVSVLLNQGDGSFKDVVSYPVAYPRARSLIAADINGDGKPDLATAYVGGDGKGTVYVLLNRGDGSFRDAVSYPAGINPNILMAADLNSDGKPDLATANYGCGDDCNPIPGSVFVLLNQGDGTFRDAVSYPGGGRSLIAADINGDGKVDLATANPDSGDVCVLLNRGDGSFKDAVSYPGEEGPGFLLVADLNGDGQPDLALTITPSSIVLVLLNHTMPPFSRDINQNGIPDECDPGAFHRGDPNSSGTSDISDGIATFGFLFLGDPPNLSCKESADVNNDGTIDISDGIYLLNWLFVGDPEPVAPGPTGAPCGFDPDTPGSPGDIGCESYSCK